MSFFVKISLLLLLLVLLGVGLYWGRWWYQLQSASNYEALLSTLYQNHQVPLLHAPTVEDWSQYLILDVRSPEEYAVSHLPEAHFVNYQNPDQAALDRLLQTDRPIVVYCSVGYRSEQFGANLRSSYPSPVYNLYGGLFQWANEKRPLVDAQQAPTQLVHGYSPSWGRWVTEEDRVVYEAPALDGEQ